MLQMMADEWHTRRFWQDLFACYGFETRQWLDDSATLGAGSLDETLTVKLRARDDDHWQVVATTQKQ